MGKDTTAQKLTDALRDHFCRTAVPDILWSDGGPQFTSAKLSNFLTTWGTTHIVSSPHYPQSNGKAEAAVKSMKKIISAAWKGRSINWDTLSRSLLQYRNTPCRNDNLSPAQHLFGHPVQDNLPAHRRSFAPEWQLSSEDADKKAEVAQENAEQVYNQHAHELPDITIGSQVAIQNHKSKLWDVYGTVTATASHRRYLVKTQSGRVLVRNRRFLRKRVPVSIGAPRRDVGLREPAPTVETGTRISTRSRQPPQRLSQDPTWLLSSLVQRHEELDGEV